MKFPQSIPRDRPRILYNTPDRVKLLKGWVQSNPINPKDAMSSGMLYLVSRKPSDADRAINALMGFTISEAELNGTASDNYRWNDWVPVVFDWVYDAMSQDQRTEFIGRYTRYAQTIMTKSWGGPKMHNNYAWGYFSNEVLWALAIYHELASEAKQILDFALTTRWQNSFLPWFDGPAAGGFPPEGSSYGVTTSSYPVKAHMTLDGLGRDMLAETSWYGDAVNWWAYWITNGKVWKKDGTNPDTDKFYQLFPWSPDESVSTPAGRGIYLGEFLTMMMYKYGDGDLGQCARTLYNKVQPPVPLALQPFITDGHAQDQLGWTPYYAVPSEYHFYRSGWEDEAAQVFLQLAYPGDSPTAHLDIGGFQILKGDRWLARETAQYSHQMNGFNDKDTQAHNCCTFGGRGHASGRWKYPPVVTKQQSFRNQTRNDQTPVVDWVRINVDLGGIYKSNVTDWYYNNPNVDTYQRGFIWIPTKGVLVVADNATVPDGATMEFNLHTQVQPTTRSTDDLSHYTFQNGDYTLSVFNLLPVANYNLIDEAAFQGQHYDSSTYQWTNQFIATGGTILKLLTVLQARRNDEPDITPVLADQVGWLLRLTSSKGSYEFDLTDMLGR